jgi:hypothetical protein
MRISVSFRQILLENSGQAPETCGLDSAKHISSDMLGRILQQTLLCALVYLVQTGPIP